MPVLHPLKSRSAPPKGLPIYAGSWSKVKAKSIGVGNRKKGSGFFSGSKAIVSRSRGIAISNRRVPVVVGRDGLVTVYKGI